MSIERNPSRPSINADLMRIGREKIYQLAGAIASSAYLSKDAVDFIPGMGASIEEDSYAELRSLLDDFEIEHATRLLLETAVIARIRSDDIKDESPEFSRYAHITFVGTLEEENLRSDLSLRESWNKIIHARTIDFNYIAPDELHFKRSISETVKLTGAKNKKEWSAVVSLDRYIRHTAAALR